MRTGTPESAGVVFDALLARGQVRIYPTPAERTHALADITAAATAARTGTGGTRPGDEVLLVADTREQVAQLNGAIRERLVADRHIEDTHPVTTWAGERVGIGDLIVTRRNNHDLEVANRDTWTVTSHGEHGTLVVAGNRGQRVLPPGYVRDHIELAYAATIYGAQGATTGAAHLIVGDHTGAAGAYVAMTRGRHSNTAHLIADTVPEARQQWIEVFTRDRADLGPAHATRLATREAATYATHRPHAVALADLREAWTHEHALTRHLAAASTRHDQLTHVVPLRAHHDGLVAAVRATSDQAWDHATHAAAYADRLDTAVDHDTSQLGGRLRREWDTDRAGAAAAAHTIHAGTGLLGQHRGAVRRATDHLHDWAERWRHIVPQLPSDASGLVAAADGVDDPYLGQAFTGYARTVAQAAHPEHGPAHAAADAARGIAQQARDASHQARTTYPTHLDDYGHLSFLADPASALAATARDVADLTDQLQAAHAAVRALLAEPTLRTLPPDRLHAEHQRWATDRHEQAQQERRGTPARDVTPSPTSGGRQHERAAARHTPEPSHGISR